MRCACCNAALNDFEATRRTVSTGDFLDMCNRCYSEIKYDVPTITREDLNPFDEADEYDELDTDLDGEEWADIWDERD